MRMKKSLLIIAALCTAFVVNAKVLNIDLSEGSITDGASATLNEDGLKVNYDLGAWGAGGVIYALDDLDVTELAFDYKSDGLIESWVSFIVYLEDSEGGQWYSAAADLSISSWNAEWESKNFMPTDILWESSTAEAPVKPFKALGFLANPSVETQGAFFLRNVQLTVPDDETALEQVNAQSKVTKIVSDGQVFFVRDGKTFNALGAEVK